MSKLHLPPSWGASKQMNLVNSSVNSSVSTSPYKRCLLRAIELFLIDNSTLLDVSESVLLQKCAECNDEEHMLLSRLLIRKATWLRSNSCQKYVNRFGGNDENVARVMNSLLSKNILEDLTEAIGIEEIICAISKTVRGEEIKQIAKLLEIKIGGTKPEMLGLIKTRITKQRTLSMDSGAKRLILMVEKILRSQNKCLYKIVRICPNVLTILRRSCRLVQISSNIASMSVHRPVDMSTPILVAFNKMRFASYEMLRTEPLFASQRKFHQWEAAQELQFAWHLAQEDVQAKETESPSSTAVLALVAEILTTCTPMFLEGAGTDPVAARDCVAQLVHRMLVHKISISETIALVSVLCFIGYDQELLDNRDCDSGRADFLIRIDAGSALASLCNEAVTLFETEVSRNYVIANHILQVLLGSVFTPHRRGKWYNRLCINNDHLKLGEIVKIIVKRGLNDPTVKMGDRLSLQRRLHTIQKHISKKASTVQPALAEITVTPDTPTVCSLVALINLSFINAAEHKDADTREACAPIKIIGLNCTVKEVDLTADSDDDDQAALSVVVATSNIMNTNFKLSMTASVKPTASLPISRPIKSTSKTMSASSALSNTPKCQWSCSLCTYSNRAGFTKCEMCGQSHQSPTAPSLPSSLASSVNNPPIVSKPIIVDMANDSDDDCVDQIKIDPIVTSGPVASAAPTHEKKYLVSEADDELSVRDLELLGISQYYNQQSICTSSKTSDVLDKPMLLAWKPSEFVVFGRRFGDKTRKGKNRFCGMHDELVDVEEYVMQKCLAVDCEDSSDFRTAVDGGGWQGWHCEGSLLFTLHGLLMWDVMFNTQADVFITPYQDAPLDLCFPSFLLRRKQLIDERLGFLQGLSREQLVAEVGVSYRSHYLQQCRGVAWERHPLHVLQLVAACAGSGAVASVCRALSVSYRHFQSGAPDLLLIRISYYAHDTHTSTSTSADNSISSHVQHLDIGTVLGQDWNVKTPVPGDDGPNPAGKLRRADRGDAVKNSELTNLSTIQNKYNRNNFKTSNLATPKNKATFFKALTTTNNESQETIELLSDMDDEDDIDNSLTLDTTEVDNSTNLASSATTNTYVDKYLCTEPDLVLPHLNSSNVDSSAANDHHGTCIPSGHNWEYECMFVEVKGPTDHLADKQVIWLLVLGAAGLRSLVGRVNEKETTKLQGISSI